MLFINGSRSGYAPDQCRKTATVQELIDFLKDGISCGNYGPDEPIYLRNDNGYTYGEIDLDSIMHGDVDDGGHEHFDDDFY